jgi:amino acid adenylation domain-containing protein
LTSSVLMNLLPATSAKVLCVDDGALAAPYKKSGNMGNKPTPESPACLIFTSGSTGLPKCVVRSQRGIVSRLAWANPAKDDIFCHNMSLATGFSQERLLIPLMSGVPLAVISEEDFKDAGKFVESIEALKVTQVTIVPMFLRQVLDLGRDRVADQLRHLRSLAVGSAELTSDLIGRFLDILPGVNLVNAYGSTETGSVIRGCMSYRHISEGATMGRPVSNAVVYVLDEALNRLPVGSVGELCVGGPPLALGYLRDPELTNRRFLGNPYRDESGADVLYRTGDRCRFLQNGEVEFLGRNDRQVKVRGYRVELGEVESHLQRHGAIQRVIVTMAATDKLVAYLEPKALSDKPTVTTLREYLSEKLPSYMIPSTFIWLEQMPLTLNGKVDTTLLPSSPIGRPLLDSPYEPARTPLEASVVALWERALEKHGLGIHDDFLALGGDSLTATEVIAGMAELGVNITLKLLFERGTIASLLQD